MEVLKQEIEKIKYLIERTSSKSNRRNYIFTLECLTSLLNDLVYDLNDYKISDKDELFLSKFDINKKVGLFDMINDSDYRSFVEKISKNSVKILKPYENSLYFNNSFSMKEAKDLVFEFFNSFDPKLYPIVKQSLDSEHLFFLNSRSQNGDGYSLCNPYTNSPYIVIFMDNKLQLDNISCLVHEIGHIISFQKTSTNPKSFNNILYGSFVEVPSFTFEFLFLEYLSKNNIHSLDVEKIIYNNMINLQFYTNCLWAINRIIDKLDIFYGYEIKEFQQILRKAGIFRTNEFCENCFTDINSKYSYSFGELLAIYYLYKYNEDKETFKKHILDFMSCIDMGNDLSMLEKFGVNIDELASCDYLKQYTDRNIKTLKKSTLI